MRLEPAIPAEALDAIRAPFAEAGATPTDAPVLQPLALLLDLAGEAMRSRLFVVQGDAGEEAALRPDFTIPIARVHIDSGAESGLYYYEGKAFRVAPAGSGRAEEFLQIGVEAYGGPDAVADDAEVAALAWSAAKAGGREDLSLVLGDVSLFSDFIDALDLEPRLASRLKRAFSRPRLLKAELDPEAAPSEATRVAALLAGLPEGEAVGVLEELWALAGIDPVGGRSAADIAHRLVERAEAVQGARLTEAQAEKVRAFLAINEASYIALDQIAALSDGVAEAVNRWWRRLREMSERGMDVEKTRLSTAFGRAFGYYDGMLFEVRSAALGDERPVAAGGRYDGLPARLGGAPSTAVGCMVRPARAFAGGVE
ncbi:MAG TPA: ATP phosphoribosyltransferase regulatory subunit [Caulobacteraceae bacterium]